MIKISALTALLFVSTAAFAEDTTVEMLNKRDDGAKWYTAKISHASK